MNIIVTRTGDAFPYDYVSMLRAMVRQHAPEHNFYCLSDLHSTAPVDRNIELPLQNRWLGKHGWWCVMDIFSPLNEYLRPCIHIDLDTYIIGPLRKLLEPANQLYLLRNFNRSGPDECGVMRVPRNTTEIWESFINTRPYARDRAPVGLFLSNFPHGIVQDAAPDTVYSYKRDCMNEPKGSVVCFHGKPKPHQVRQGWAKGIWDTYLDLDIDQAI